METAKPSRFLEKVKWDYWSQTLINFFRSIPGCNGVPLSYVIQNNVAPQVIPGVDFIQDSIHRAPLTGDAFTQDAAEVHTYIVNFVAGNPTTESKLMPHTEERNGRVDFISLKEHYKGIGMNAINIIAADKIMANLHYSGEKGPHMWWSEFEKQLTRAFVVYNKREGHQVYLDEMKLRCLIGKVNADFLQNNKNSLEIELTRIPMTMTFATALATFRNLVNKKYPPNVLSGAIRDRHIHEYNTRGRSDRGRIGRDGRGRSDYYYRGRGGGRDYYRGRRCGERDRGRGRGRGSRDYNSNASYYGDNSTRNNDNGRRHVTLMDGTHVEVHPADNISHEVWTGMHPIDRDDIIQARQNHKRQRMSEIDTNQNETPSVISALTQERAPNDDQHSIMGGRNEQSQLRTCRPGR